MDRERAHTAAAVLEAIDKDTFARLLASAEASPESVDTHLAALDGEWDTDRTIELEAAGTGLVLVAVGAFAGRRWLALPAFVAGSVMLHALTGLYPLLPLLRRAGLRTAREIARERYALKALRGDFRKLEVSVQEETGTPLAQSPAGAGTLGVPGRPGAAVVLPEGSTS